MAELSFGVKIGTHDIIENNKVVKDVADKLVYVTQQSELSKFANYPAGTFAATYGMKHMWQKKPDGTWEQMI